MIAALYSPVRIWLLCVAALVFVMVIVGGATRLTDSGLSITEWQPLLGAIPPLTEAAWLEAFQKYKQIPEYHLINKGMSLDEFRFIYWWEWGHRFLGRIIGLAYALPLFFFWIKGYLPQRAKPWLFILLLLGGLQGAIGWWMVKSGLSERVDVSHYRLMIHLVIACLIYAALLIAAVRIAPFTRLHAPRWLKISLTVFIGIIAMQIALGALVAGSHAGKTFTTWPLMDGAFVPSGLFLLEPWWLNFGENPLTVQFNHRITAYALCLLAALLSVLAILNKLPLAPLLMAGFMLVMSQAAIGILTLLGHTPLHLALLHQADALVVLGWYVVIWARLR